MNKIPILEVYYFSDHTNIQAAVLFHRIAVTAKRTLWRSAATSNTQQHELPGRCVTISHWQPNKTARGSLYVLYLHILFFIKTNNLEKMTGLHIVLAPQL